MKPTCQHKNVVSWLSLLDNVTSLLVVSSIHALHHVFDLLRIQSLQKLIIIKSICNELLLTSVMEKICQLWWIKIMFCYLDSLHLESWYNYLCTYNFSSRTKIFFLAPPSLDHCNYYHLHVKIFENIFEYFLVIIITPRLIITPNCLHHKCSISRFLDTLLLNTWLWVKGKYGW